MGNKFIVQMEANFFYLSLRRLVTSNNHDICKNIFDFYSSAEKKLITSLKNFFIFH